MLARNELIKEINNLLNSEGFETSNVYDQRCFDLIARKKLLILLLKTFTNVDSINETHAEEMRKISQIFLASPLIVGEKSKNGLLEEDVVYERHGVPAICLNTLKNMILYNEYPEVLADRGGYYVKINGDVLKEYREEYSLSLKDLADLAHVSRTTMYKYENGIVKTNTETAMMLEDILNTKITVDIDLFEPYSENEENKDKNLELNRLGYGVISTNKSPFDTVAKSEEEIKSSLMFNMEKNRKIKTLEKMAISLKDLSNITSSEPAFIIKNEKLKESIDGIPVIKSWELKEFGNSKDLLKVIKERKDN
ncbi:transcriptional regulator [Methanobrevibacter sp. DSM 116169]|uniref:transcriptional regulator n=1 Tax=Methanobrevibacter sp. DSM 116169 TaxID=3242727 RepID=UPI0038FC8F76